MSREHSNAATRIQELNDAFHRSFIGGVVVVTTGFESLPADRRRLILTKVRGFDQFDDDTTRTASTTSVSSKIAESGASGRSIFMTEKSI
jgi:hypothetical protein